jgi:hypothetical protein
VRRREFITLLGGAAAWPVAARAQQAALPVIGFLNPGFRSNVWTALIGGLRDIGYVDGETIKIEPRWALGRPETLPGLAQELVRLKAVVVVAVGRPSIEAVRAATTNLVPTFPQRSPPLLLTTVACGGLRSTPDCRPRRTSLHLSYSYAAPCGPVLLATQCHEPTHAVQQKPLHELSADSSTARHSETRK